MKYLLAWLFAALLGACAAAVVLYYNPLTGQPARSVPADAWLLQYEFPSASSIALTHGGLLSLPAIPEGIEPLWESTINALALNVLLLGDANGAVEAIATRISVPSPDTNLLLRGVVVADDWLVTVPGEGTFAVRADNNLWPLLKETFISVSYLKREWRGPSQYFVTAGPGGRTRGEADGINGRFAGMRGAATETYDLRRFSAAHGIEAMRGTLAVEFDTPAEVAASSEEADSDGEPD